MACTERRATKTCAAGRIIERAKHQCNLVWLENLNLRGDYKKRILSWVHEHHPELDELYHEIYTKKRCPFFLFSLASLIRRIV